MIELIETCMMLMIFSPVLGISVLCLHKAGATNLLLKLWE